MDINSIYVYILMSDRRCTPDSMKKGPRHTPGLQRSAAELHHDLNPQAAQQHKAAPSSRRHSAITTAPEP